MRILVLGNLPPWVLGGAENQIARLVEAWAYLGHHVEVAGHRIPDSHAKLGSYTATIHRIAIVDNFGRAGRAVSYLVSLARLLHRIGRDFDVVYCRGLSDGAISLCLLKTLGWTDLPMAANPINARGAGDANFIRSIPGWQLIVKAIKRHCGAINLIAPAMETDLQEIGLIGPRLSRIPNGITLLPAVVRLAVSPIRRLIWTGRLSPQKGLDLLLPALARIIASGRDFHLQIVGDGPEMATLVAYSQELGLVNKISFVGPVHRDEIRQRLTGADVFILPSRYEGMSNAALEAMEAGLPVVLTRCGGIDTYVDEGIGWLCEPQMINSLYATLCIMLDTPDSELLAMGKRARELVEREFEIRSVAFRNVALLTEIAKCNTV